MKTYLFISFLAAAVLLTAAAVRADLGHSWDSGSELPAAVDSSLSSSDSSAEPASGDSSDTPAPPSPSLDAQIADLLDEESLATSSSSSLDLSTLTVPLSEEEVLLDRLAVEVAAEVAADAEAPSTPDTSAPIGVSDTAFATGTDRIATRVSSVMAVRGVSPAATAPSFTASDNSRNKPYASSGNWNRGDNGGTGFGEWRQVGSTALPNRSIDESKCFSMYANAGVGEAAIGRSFADGIALESGTFTVDAAHDSTANFSGFAIYGGDTGETELFRWGVATKENPNTGAPATGFWYGLNEGGTIAYSLIASAPAETLQSRIDYSLTWTLLDGNLDINLAIKSKTDEPWTDTFHRTLDTSSAITAIAAIATGSDPDDTLHFDNLSVEGRAVPEPATILLLSLGTLLLATRRRR